MPEAKRTSPEETFDSVIVPALAMARRDHDDGDLDATDLQVVVRAAREVAEEVAELRTPPVSHPDERVRVLVCPARDETEYVVAELLALTLDSNLWEVRVAGDETLAAELIEVVADYRPAVVVIATMPPGGLSHASRLPSKRNDRPSTCCGRALPRWSR